MLSGILKHYDKRHLARIDRENKASNGSCEVIEVNCYSLMKILQDQNLLHVDYLSIDTEGCEFAILKSIDFDRLDIDVISVENNYGENFEQFLTSKGYKKLVYLSGDEIYQKIKVPSVESSKKIGS